MVNYVDYKEKFLRNKSVSWTLKVTHERHLVSLTDNLEIGSKTCHPHWMCLFYFRHAREGGLDLTEFSFHLHWLMALIDHFFSFWRNIYLNSSLILKSHYLSTYCWVVTVLRIFWRQVPYWIGDLQLFSFSLQAVFSLLWWCPLNTKAFHFEEIFLIFFFFFCCFWWVLCDNHCLI
jgi:hypothetical protein